MYRGRASCVALTVLLGLLALAPAPAAAAGAKPLPGGRDAATDGSPAASSVQQAHTPRRVLPVHRQVGTGAATARPADALRSPVALPNGIGKNIQVSPVTSTDRFSETAVAIDPNDATGQHLAVSSNFLTGATHISFTSGDGGQTWQSALVASNVGASFYADPGVAYDTTGTAVHHLIYSILGIDINGNSVVEVTQEQADGTNQLPNFTSANFDVQPDRPMLAADPRTGSGIVYVAWDTNPTGPGAGQPLRLTKSLHFGVSWDASLQVWNSGGDIGAWPVVGADGTVYIAWDDYCGNTPGTLNLPCAKPGGQILLSKSTDTGNTWLSTPIHITDTTTGFGSILPNYATECTQGCPARPVNPSPQLAIDRSGGARNGTLYVVYSDGADPQFGASTVPSAHRMHVFLQESKDGGTTWSSRIRIDAGNPNDAWEPSVAVDQSNGNVVVSWYDRRDDGSNHLYVPYFTESLSDSNNVAQFTAQLPVADTQSDPEVDCNGTGDYMQIAAAAGIAHPVWTDSRSGLPAVFTSAISEATAATTTSTTGTRSSPLRPAAGTGWIGLPGGARDIGVGADCTAWIIGENAIAGGGETWVWGGPSRGWQPFVGGGVRITVHALGLPRVVNNTGGIFRLQSNGVWLQAPGGGLDIASGPDQSLWLIGLDAETGGHGVWQFTGSGWNFAGGAGERIAVGPDGLPWIVNNAGQIWHLTPGGWADVPGGARDIGVGADGSVWIIGLNPIVGGWQTWRFNGSGWDAVNGGGVAISVGPDGMPWVVNSAGQMFERV